MPLFVRQVCRAVLLASALVYGIVGALALVRAAGGLDEVLNVLKALDAQQLSTMMKGPVKPKQLKALDAVKAGGPVKPEQLKALDADKWVAQLEPSILLLLSHIGVAPDHPQLQQAKVGLLNVKEQLQIASVQCCQYFGVEHEIQYALLVSFLWLVALLFVSMHLIELVVRTLVGTGKAVRCALQHCKRNGGSSQIEVTQFDKAPPQPAPAAVTAPSATEMSAPVTTMVEQAWEQPLEQQENIFTKQNQVAKRIDSPVKKRQTKKEVAESSEDPIIFTRQEPVIQTKKTRGNSKRNASPAPKVQKEEKPRGPENWGDNEDMCKSAVLITMLNDGSEEMLCGMLQSMTAKSAKQIVEFRAKNGDFTTMSQVDTACHKGFAAKLLKAN